MLKTMFFDLGNVLVFFNPEQMRQQIADCCGLTTEQVRKLLVCSDISKEYETGKIDSKAVYHAFRKEATRPFSEQDLMQAISQIFTPNYELWSVVQAMKQQGVRLILISNTCDWHFRYIQKHYSILQLFDHTVLSYEVGAMKPSPHIYQQALLHAQHPLSACFYTDDIPEYVLGARGVGLDSEIFTNVEAFLRDVKLRGWSA